MEPVRQGRAASSGLRSTCKPGTNSAGAGLPLRCHHGPYNAKARLVVACPITSQVKGYPVEVPLPPTGTIVGVVLADHVKNLDWQARKIVFEAKAPVDVLADVKERLKALLGV